MPTFGVRRRQLRRSLGRQRRIMSQATIIKIAYCNLMLVGVIASVLFGSLAFAIQTCNVETWISAASPFLGQAFVSSLNIIWGCLVLATLFPLVYSFTLAERARLALLSVSTFILLILILVRSIDLVRNC